MNGGTTASVTGASTATIQDINTTLLRASSTATATAGTSKLTTVNLQGTTGTVTIASDALTNLSIVDTATSTVTVNSNTGANTGALNLSIGNSGSSGSGNGVKVQQGNATSVAVTAVASPYAAKEATKNTNAAYLDLEAAKATSLSFGGSTAKIFLNSAAGDLAKLTTITANGSGALDLGVVSDFTKLTSVDASAASGKITLSVGPTIGVSNVDNHGLAIKTGSADDTVTLTGAISSGTDTAGNVVVQTVALGAGNDKVKSSSGSIGTGATVDGGEGTDVVASSLLNAGNASRVTNFELLGLDSSGTFDASLLVGATGLYALNGGGTYTGVTTSQGITFGENIASGTNTLTFSSTVTGTTSKADAYTITFAATAGTSATATSKDAISGSTLAIDGIEAVNIASGGTGFVANSLTLTAAAARTITVTGDQDLNLTLSSGTGNGVAPSSTNGNGVSLIDGSAMTGKFTISNANIVAPDGGVSTIKGGSGKDTITAALAKTIVDGGAGDDQITVSGEHATTLTGGEGKDTFILTSATASSNFATAPIITTIKDYDRTNDTIQIGDADPLKKFVPTTGNTFLEVLTAAFGGTSASPVSGGAAASSAVWFTYGGDTYIAKQDSTNTFGSGDIVVKLTGIVDLTTAADNAAGNTTGLVGGA
jgi:S-layer protein